jgi:hypothetical protein
MSHCQDEHKDYHDHGGHGHNHSKDPELERGFEYSLYKYIDTSKVFCLNEAEKGSIVNVFKPWHDRLSQQGSVSSDTDQELLIHIPFTGVVKLKSLMIVGGTNGRSPKKMRAFINRDDLDFSSVQDMKSVQEWDLQEDYQGVMEYPTRIAKFINVYSLILHIPENFGNDVTTIYYIGLKGDFEVMKREAVVTTYESKPMAKDHKTKSEWSSSQGVQ